MASSLRALRKEAREKGIEGYRSMSVEDLQEALVLNGNAGATPSKRKKVSKRKSVTKKGARSAEKPRKTPAAKAKRSAKASTPSPAGVAGTKKDGRLSINRKRTKVGERKNLNNAGKFFIQRLKFTGYDSADWNPREGSLTAAVFASVKKAKGDRQVAFEELFPLWNKEPLNLHKKRDGSKRTKDEARAYLGYVISRVLWDFARKTGQHKVSKNRTEYGTGDYAKVKKAPTKKAKAKPAAKKRKRGRPPKK